MKDKVIAEGISAPLANYSHSILVKSAADTLYISGQLGIGHDPQIPNSVEEQAWLCFGNIDSILESNGMARQDVVKITAYVTSRDSLVPYMRIRDKWIKQLCTSPASTLLIVSGFSRAEFKIEIEVIACRVTIPE